MQAKVSRIAVAKPVSTAPVACPNNSTVSTSASPIRVPVEWTMVSRCRGISALTGVIVVGGVLEKTRPIAIVSVLATGGLIKVEIYSH